MSESASAATQIARDYYNSSDADNFYYHVWGGEDIHVGMYASDDEPIKQASRRTVDFLADRLKGLGRNSTVLDLGSGYGGAARRLAERFGCRVVCVNLAEAENDRNRELTRSAGLSDRIDVIDGSFESLAFEDETFDFAWSQDAILHSGDRPRVLREVNRVLKAEGQFVFTDPMQADNCPSGVLDPILARIHLPDLGSPAYYQSLADDLNWRDLGFQDHTHQLIQHYSRVLQVTEQRRDELRSHISAAYIDRMRSGLTHWIEGGKQAHLCWGVFLFQKF